MQGLHCLRTYDQQQRWNLISASDKTRSLTPTFGASKAVGFHDITSRGSLVLRSVSRSTVTPYKNPSRSRKPEPPEQNT